MNQLERRFLAQTIKSARGTFGVTFTKKDGEIRRMRCGKKTKNYLKGGKASYDAAEKNLMRVVDVDFVRKAKKENKSGAEVAAIRAIPLDTISELRCNGVTYTIIGNLSEQSPEISHSAVSAQEQESKLA